MRIEIDDNYNNFRDELTAVPQYFAKGEGTVLYDGRNQIRKFHLNDTTTVVVKRFKKHNFLKQIIYTFFRTNKARRAFDNAQELLRRGFDTPHPIAWWEEKRMGLIRQVYYACEYTEAEAIRPRLIDQEPFDEHLAKEYAHFVASLHESGILHRDLNPTNVLFRGERKEERGERKEKRGERNGERGERNGDSQHPTPDIHFLLIDINRMRFYDGAVPKAECMENLTLFWWLTDVYRFVLQEYAATRGWTDEDIAEAVKVKQRHDKAWVRRKNFTAFFKNIINHSKR